MSNSLGEINPVGYLEVWKVYENGEEELHFSDNNVITSGMGVGFALLFGRTGSDNILDYQIKYMQVGVSANEDYGVSTYTLGDELTAAEYDTSSLRIYYGEQIKNKVVFEEDMVVLPQTMIRRKSLNSIEYVLTLDTDTANEQTLNEIGMLMKNPKGVDPPQAILVAYRIFSDITKKREFSLIFKWTISF